MRDGASGRSRGFGFLTFKDPRTVNVVMVKEHYLDGKIVRTMISTSTKTPSRLLRSRPESSHFISSKIDPKRAIPRDEQERTSKIFVGGVSQDANEQDFKDYFTQFGRVVDATLMIDKDTGRPRGFGFVTFDSEAAVDATLQGDLQILGKPIEVKKAQPRGNMREEEETANRRGGRRGGKDNDRFRDNDRGTFENGNNAANNNANPNNQNQSQNQQVGQGMYGSGMTPQMLAQYWQKMQQYFATMQQQMAQAAAVQNGGIAGQMGMAGMNPVMLQQMQAMQQMKQMQAMQQQMARQQGSQSPLPQSPGAQAMQAMNPAMLQQMQQMQQMQLQQQAQAGGAFGGAIPGAPQINNSPASGAAGMGNFGARRGTPGYNAQDQLLFEQQKYEQQQARRAAQEAQQMQSYQQGGPTSWEGMYDDVPQPNLGGPQAGGMGRGGGFAGQGANGNNKGGQQPNRGSQGPQSAPPANAPTGPKNAGKPGANYRGGGRGAHRGFHPYNRN